MENVWNQRDNQFIRDHLGCDCQIEGLPESCQTPEGFAAFRDGLVAGIPDLRVEVIECIQEGEKVAGVLRVVGTHGATGKPVDFQVGCTAVVRDDRIVEARNVVDFLTMLQQAELLPVDVVERSFLGEN